MKKLLLVPIVLLASVTLIPAETALSGLFNAADQIVSEIPSDLSGEETLLLGGVSKDGMYVQLGDLMADLTANRLTGRDYPGNVVKMYSSPQFNPSRADRILSGVLYKAGQGYLLIMTLSDHEGTQIKGWEFILSQSDAEEFLVPSLMAVSGGWDRYEPNDSRSTAAAVELPFTEISLTLSSDDQDWFSFEVPAEDNSYYILNAYTTGDLDTYMELYPPEDISSFAEDDDGGDDSNAKIQTPLSRPGTWYLKVRGYSNSAEGEYGLSISLDTLEAGPGEPDESPETANSLSIGAAPMNKEIYYGSDEDWFRVDLTEPLSGDEALRIATTGSVDTVMKLLSSSEDYLAGDDDSGEGNNAMITIGNLSAGTYFAVVSSYGSETGDYRITAEVITPQRDDFEEDDTMETASSIEIDGDPQQRTFSPAGDTDWVKFQVGSEGHYLMKTMGDIDTYMELYDEDGSMIDENDDGDDYNAMILQWLDQGTYYMMIRPYDSASPDEVYELVVESR